MNSDTRKAELQKALDEWKKKYHVKNNDPLMATLDLWQILMESSHAADPGEVFRRELEQLTTISKTFSKQVTELTGELRKVPKIKSDLWLFPYFAVILVAVSALIIGIFVGKFIH